MGAHAAPTNTTEPLATSAQYYLAHREYAQALTLWQEVLKRQPESLTALFRVSELKLMLEGRPASRDLMRDFLTSRSSGFDPESKRAVRERFQMLQTLFITDEGQTAYLQGLTRLERKDFQGALSALDHSAVLEKGNITVLKEKALCERQLFLSEPFFQTAKSAYENFPFDPEIVANLSEGYAFKAQYAKILELYSENPEAFTASRNRTAYAVALAETGAVSAAVPLLQSLVGRGRMMKATPILWYELATSLSHRPDSLQEATNYMEQFLRSTAPAEDKAVIAPWDPYHTKERRAAAEKLLVSLKEPEKTSK